MAMEQISALLGHGGVGFNDKLPKVIKELAGLNVSVVDGAAAGTAMDIAAIRDGDTILAAVNFADAGGAPVDDAANITIQSCKAKGTITLANAVPAAGDTVTVRGVVYTFKAANTLTANTHVLIGATLAATATNLAAVINAYESAWLGNAGQRVPLVIASADNAVVTITAINEGTAANDYTLAKTFATGANCSVSGAKLAGGTATGSIKSTTNLSAATLLVFWFNKA